MTALQREKATLLALVSPALPDPSAAQFAALGTAGWQSLDAMAAQHRLQPWLHYRMGNAAAPWPVPEEQPTRWRSAYRAEAVGALTAQAALVELARAFDDAGVAMVALKGAYLAFFSYPEAALRPMRDIDLLVAPEDLPRALDAMAAAGCELPADRESAIARALVGDKHIDPAFLPRFGRWVELHHRLTDPPLASATSGPGLPTADVIARAVERTLGGQRMRFPGPNDMLAHLVLHAVHTHRFDCGPLALADIAMLAEQESIDWDALLSDAASGGWERGAQLILALVDRYFGPLGAPTRQDVPAEAVGWASDLMLQDFAMRDQIKLATEAQDRGMARLAWARLRKGLADPGDKGRIAWLRSRIARTLRQSGNARARGEADAAGQLARWLQPNGPAG